MRKVRARVLVAVNDQGDVAADVSNEWSGDATPTSHDAKQEQKKRVEMLEAFNSSLAVKFYVMDVLLEVPEAPDDVVVSPVFVGNTNL